MVLGLTTLFAQYLEAVKEAGQKLQSPRASSASIADDVPAQLALATIDSIFVLGILQAGPAVKAALADRIH